MNNFNIIDNFEIPYMDKFNKSSNKKKFLILLFIVLLVTLISFVFSIVKSFQGFNKIVIISATVVLCIILLTLSITLTAYKNNIIFPPIDNQCPDYWDISYGSAGSLVCNNVNNINSSNTGLDKCKSPFYPASHDAIDVLGKRKWAIECGVEWDAAKDNFTT
tara:strand:- start:580 stop:1065 length:486 start_codon:yes stop_codon:yes gene_type:complete